jgi:GNAT superfamily N-acetyltransferase
VVGILHAPGSRDGAIVAHGQLRGGPAGEAEAAFVVADALQGRGIGRALVAAIVAGARSAGYRRLGATTLADNRPMRHLLLDAGARVVVDRVASGLEEIVLSLDP